MSELGRCALEAGRPLEAEGLFRRVLEIADARLEPDDVLVVVTLHGESLRNQLDTCGVQCHIMLR